MNMEQKVRLKATSKNLFQNLSKHDIMKSDKGAGKWQSK